MTKKTIWIMGASSGIGAAVAKKYSKHGFKVVLSARDREQLEVVSRQLQGENAVEPYDALSFSNAEREVNRIWNEHGSIHTFIYSAGVSQRAYALETELKVDRQIMDLNYFGAVAVAKVVVPLMIENGGGRVGVLSSVMGKYSSPLRTAYAASKHALHGFFEGLRAETAKTGVTFTMIAPGFVRTQISYRSLKGNGEQYGKMAKPQQGGMEPEELADKIFNAVESGKREIALGGFWEKLGLFLRRFFPAVFAWAIVKKNVT